jgi:hypothetical protein
MTGGTGNENGGDFLVGAPLAAPRLPKGRPAFIGCGMNYLYAPG